MTDLPSYDPPRCSHNYLGPHTHDAGNEQSGWIETVCPGPPRPYDADEIEVESPIARLIRKDHATGGTVTYDVSEPIAPAMCGYCAKPKAWPASRARCGFLQDHAPETTSSDPDRVWGVLVWPNGTVGQRRVDEYPTRADAERMIRKTYGPRVELVWRPDDNTIAPDEDAMWHAPDCGNDTEHPVCPPYQLGPIRRIPVAEPGPSDDIHVDAYRVGDQIQVDVSYRTPPTQDYPIPIKVHLADRAQDEAPEPDPARCPGLEGVPPQDEAPGYRPEATCDRTCYLDPGDAPLCIHLHTHPHGTDALDRGPTCPGPVLCQHGELGAHTLGADNRDATLDYCNGPTELDHIKAGVCPIHYTRLHSNGRCPETHRNPDTGDNQPCGKWRDPTQGTDDPTPEPEGSPQRDPDPRAPARMTDLEQVAAYVWHLYDDLASMRLGRRVDDLEPPPFPRPGVPRSEVVTARPELPCGYPHRHAPHEYAIRGLTHRCIGVAAPVETGVGQ